MFPTIDKRETGMNLRQIMDGRGITAREVQQYLGLGCVQSVYRWLEGKSMPTIDNLYALSELFHMPIDEIVRGNRRAMKHTLITGNKSSFENRVYAYFNAFQRRYIA